MEPIRVIGRIDLAQQIHAALVAEGVDARLATAAPMAVVAQTGRDGTGIDILANGFELCPSLKKAAPGRPLVVVTFDETGSEFAETYAASLAKTSRGPDVHLPWPATGRELLEACDRAVERARVPRPRFSLQDVTIRLIGLAMLGALIWFVSPAGPARRLEPLGPRARILASLLQAAVFGASAWWGFRRARTSRRPGWHRGWAIFSAAIAGLNLLGAAATLLE
jgi:hypothetical protein